MSQPSVVGLPKKLAARSQKRGTSESTQTAPSFITSHRVPSRMPTAPKPLIGSTDTNSSATTSATGGSSEPRGSTVILRKPNTNPISPQPAGNGLAPPTGNQNTTVAESSVLIKQNNRPPNDPSKKVAAIPENQSENARKAAAFAAEDEYVQALRWIAHSRDSATKSEEHRQALIEAFVAFDEADDFAETLVNFTTKSDVQHVVASHRTPVLKNVKQDRIPALDALQSYYAFTADRLAVSLGQDKAASVALCGLAQLQELRDQAVYPNRTMGAARAILLLQASLAADETNTMAAKELGELYTRYGRLEQSRAVAVYVDDIQCKNCAKKIARNLYSVPGVVAVHADMEQNAVIITPQNDKDPAPQAIWEAVESANFKPVKLIGPYGTFHSLPQD